MRSLRFLPALFLVLLVPVAHAGPALDALIDRAHAADRGSADGPGLAPLLPRVGLALAWGEPQGVTHPGVVANEFVGRGGLRLQVDAFDRRGPWRARAGLMVQGEGASRRWSLEGTGLAVDVGDAPGAGEFYASVERRHWGPGWAGSLILDGAAPGVPAFGWRRVVVQPSANPWLAWIGPWGADVFAGRLTRHVQPARPTLIGMRVQFAPVDGIDIGLARTMQWGGRGRDESASSLWHAFTGNDNVGFGGITLENEPGNQLAGGDLRWRIHDASTTSIYAQWAGEDEAGKFTSRNMALAGMETRVPTPRGSVRMFVEWSDTLAGRITSSPRPGVAYRHAVYAQGYTHEGVLLAQPTGGDVTLTSLGWVVRDGPWAGTLMVSTGRAEPTAQRFAPGRVHGVNTAWRVALPGEPRSRVGLRGSWWRDSAGRRSAVQLYWQVDLP